MILSYRRDKNRRFLRAGSGEEVSVTAKQVCSLHLCAWPRSQGKGKWSVEKGR